MGPVQTVNTPASRTRGQIRPSQRGQTKLSQPPTLRHSGKLLHLGIGRAHSRTEIIALIHNNDATIANQSTGEIHAHFTLDPTRGYQRKSG